MLYYIITEEKLFIFLFNNTKLTKKANKNEIKNLKSSLFSSSYFYLLGNI